MRSIYVTSVIGIALLFLVLSIPANAQLFPSGGLPMLYNGGFAGESGKHRMVSSTEFHLSHYEKLRTKASQTFSYDAFVPSWHSGIGATAGFMFDHFEPVDSTRWDLRVPYFSIAVSPKISFGGKFTLAPFVDFKYEHSRSVSYYRLNLADPPMTPTNSRYTLRTGFLLNSAKGYVGLTYLPLEKTRYSESRYSYRFVNYTNPGPGDTKLILQAGRTFQRKNKVDPKFSFTPQFALSFYKSPRRYYFYLLDINVAFRFKRLHAGVGIDGFQAAYDWNNLRIGTSVIFFRPYRRSGYSTFSNGQPVTYVPYQYVQFLSVRYLIDADQGKL